MSKGKLTLQISSSSCGISQVVHRRVPLCFCGTEVGTKIQNWWTVGIEILCLTVQGGAVWGNSWSIRSEIWCQIFLTVLCYMTCIVGATRGHRWVMWNWSWWFRRQVPQMCWYMRFLLAWWSHRHGRLIHYRLQGMGYNSAAANIKENNTVNNLCRGLCIPVCAPAASWVWIWAWGQGCVEVLLQSWVKGKGPRRQSSVR